MRNRILGPPSANKMSQASQVYCFWIIYYENQQLCFTLENKHERWNYENCLPQKHTLSVPKTVSKSIKNDTNLLLIFPSICLFGSYHILSVLHVFANLALADSSLYIYFKTSSPFLKSSIPFLRKSYFF